MDATKIEAFKTAIRDGHTIRGAASIAGIGYGTANKLAAIDRSSGDVEALKGLMAALGFSLERIGVDDGNSAPPMPPSPPADTGVFDVRSLLRLPERIAFLSDLHHPFHDQRAIDCVFAVLRDWMPDLIILGGDYFDCYSISAHSKEPGRADRIQDEFASATPNNQAVEDIANGCPVLFLEGNHEERLTRVKAANPGLHNCDALRFDKVSKIPERWTFLRNQTRIKAGPLSILHGDIRGRGTATQHAAATMLRKLRTSCLFGHLHRFQSFYETSADDGVVRGAIANGHLSKPSEATYITSPDWQQGATLIDFDWSSGSGLWSHTPLMVINGAIRWRGKTYRG